MQCRELFTRKVDKDNSSNDKINLVGDDSTMAYARPVTRRSSRIRPVQSCLTDCSLPHTPMLVSPKNQRKMNQEIWCINTRREWEDFLNWFPIVFLEDYALHDRYVVRFCFLVCDNFFLEEKNYNRITVRRLSEKASDRERLSSSIIGDI